VFDVQPTALLSEGRLHKLLAEGAQMRGRTTTDLDVTLEVLAEGSVPTAMVREPSASQATVREASARSRAITEPIPPSVIQRMVGATLPTTSPSASPIASPSTAAPIDSPSESPIEPIASVIVSPSIASPSAPPETSSNASPASSSDAPTSETGGSRTRWLVWAAAIAIIAAAFLVVASHS
jgi:hypothetical protein